MKARRLKPAEFEEAEFEEDGIRDGDLSGMNGLRRKKNGGRARLRASSS
jgi:hypothetical protein